MRVSKILVHFLVYIFFVITYLFISIFLNYKTYNIFLIFSNLIIAGITIFGAAKAKGKNMKLRILRKVNPFTIIFMCTVIFISKDLIDHVNITILKKSNQDIPVYSLVKNSLAADRERKVYDREFKTSTYQNVTLYYKNDFEPALELVNAYLDKAKADNIRLFGDIEVSDLAIKFDYDEEVFKKRDPAFKDYSGLYVKNEKIIYLLIKDCYSNALALNIKSSYLRQTLLHEYTHHIVYEFLKSNQIPESKIPIWFIEGISEYMGYEGDSGNPPVKMSGFQELSTRKQWTEHNNKEDYPYEQSHYAVRELALLKGEKVIKEILLKTKDRDFETAFNEVSGLSLHEYEKKLNEDFKNGWKEYNKMIPVYYPKLYTEVKTKCFEKYIGCNPDNINALLDLAQLYEIGGNKEKTKQILEEAVAVKPDNKMTWYRLALINQEMDDFDGAIKAFEKEISVDGNPAVSYLCLAQTLLTKDLNKAVSAAQKALEFDKSDYVKKETQAIYDFQSSIKKGKPYEGGLQLIRSDTIYSDNIKRAIIEKLISDYPEIKNSARNELGGIMNKLKEK